MIIRDAIDSDNEKMIEIQKEASQIGGIEIVLLKSDFKTKSDFFDDGFFLVAEDETTKDIIGYMGVGIGDFKVNDKIVKGAYFYDLRTNSKYRRKIARWLKNIIEEASRRLKEKGIYFYFVSVKSDNNPSMKLMKHFSLDPICEFAAYSIPVFNKKISKKVEINTSFDLQNLEKLYGFENKDVDFIPLGLKKLFFEPLMKKKKLFRFKYKSAVLYGWDTTNVSDIGIIKISNKLKILQKVLYFTSKIIPFINAPELNKKMKNFQVFYFSYKNINDLKKLLKTLSGFCYRNKYYLINFFIEEKSELNRNILGKLKFQVNFTILANSFKEINLKKMKNFIWLPRL